MLLEFYVVAWVHQKWCIHCAAIHHQMKLKIFLRNLTRFKGQPQNILGTVLSNESWHQAYLSSLPINKTGIRIRRASDQKKAAYIGSISQSATLVDLITGQSPTADYTFTKIVD